MSNNEKKIVFTGQDGGVSQTAKKIYNDILADAKKYSDVLKDQTSYITTQVKELEKKSKLESKEGKATSRELEELYRSTSQPERKQKYAEQQLRVNTELKESAQNVEILKALLEETKKQNISVEKAEREKKRSTFSSEEQFFAMQSLARQEVRENKEGVRKKVRDAERSKFEGLDPNTSQKLMYQKTLIGEDREQRSMIGQVFAGTLLAGVVTQVIRQMSQIVGSKSGQEGINTLLGSVPVFGGLLGGASQRNFEEQLGIQTKELGLFAKSGTRISGLSNQANLGYSTKESLNMIEGLVSAAGSAKGANQGQSALLLQRGLGLSQETITQVLKDVRTTRSSADIMQIVSDVLRANPELRRDQTKFSEILNQTSQLTNQLASQSENVNIRDSAGIVGALRSVGGSFADPNLGPKRMMSINQSLTNPNTDFQKARSFGVLSKMNPGASWFKINEMMEGGVGQKKYLSGMLNQFSKESGGGEESMATMIQQNLGLNFSSSRKLAQRFKKNPKFVDNFSGGLNDIEKQLGLTARAEASTSQRDKEMAEIDNAFSISEAAGTIKVASLTFKAGADIIKEVGTKLNEVISQALGTRKNMGTEKKDPRTGKNVSNVMKMGANGVLIDSNGVADQ